MRTPFHYQERVPADDATALKQRLDTGDSKLAWDAHYGYLPAVLEAFNIDPATQMLVFSKTSLQLHRISPDNPRAIYFSDDVYVGWVPGGDVVEISAVDPELGAIFYTIDQDPNTPAKLLRDKGQCLTCHASSRTQGVPGHLVRSVFSDSRGQPILGSGTFTTDHTSPFNERWGGWYVTGTHGEMRHMGNVIASSKARPEELDRETGANRQSLDGLVDTSRYLRPTSDIVALMVLEHQTQMHNLIARASYEARHAAHLDGIMNKALDRDPNYQSESTERRIARAGDKLLECLLYSGEFQLTSPVAGSAEFVKSFAAHGPEDSQGRSLRDFDLEHRMFRYPCSYLIYSDAFAQLPQPVRRHVLERLRQVLSGEDQSETFAHLTADDRQAIREILEQTLPGLLAPSGTP
ncbi:MAG: hypothetical protein R3B90_14885 [Planctomycetaceae bacterium]